MKYLSVAISAIASKPSLLLLFIFFNLLGIPIAIMKQTDMVQGIYAFVLMVTTTILSTFLATGVYALAWKQIKGEPANLYNEAKEYFYRVLGILIFIGIIGFIATMLFFAVHKSFILPDVPAAIYSKRIDANIVRSMPAFFVSVIFVYAFPAIFVSNLSGMDIISNAWRFFLKHFSKSGVIIILLLCSTIGRIILTQWAISFDKSSSQYWQITVLSNTFTYAMTFLTFLIAVQLFDKLFQRNEQL